MNWLTKQNKGLSLLPFLIGLFVVALQIQWTLSVTNWEIRLSLSDLLLPFLILYLGMGKRSLNLFALFKEKTWIFVWIIAFSSWLGFSLLQGYFETGKLSSWAFFNKFLGWFILVGYLFVGNEFLKENEQKLEDGFLKILLISSACVSIISLIAGIGFNYGLRLVGIDNTARFVGFLENANAYGLFCVFVLLLQLPLLQSRRLFSQFTHILIGTLNVISVACSGSRSAWGALLIGLIVFLIFKIKIKKLIFISICAFLALSFLNLRHTNYYLVSRPGSLVNFSYSIFQQVENIPLEWGIVQRINNTKRAVEYWKESPVLGIGLGQFLVKQAEDKHSGIQNTIHNTSVWLLTETGIIGLFLFAVFFIKIFQVLLREIKFSASNTLIKSSIAVLAGFSVASLTTEVLYQRYLWFFLGIILSCVNCQRLFVNEAIGKVTFNPTPARLPHLYS